MLPHVVLEVVEELHLLLYIGRELTHCVVVLEMMCFIKFIEHKSLVKLTSFPS